MTTRASAMLVKVVMLAYFWNTKKLYVASSMGTKYSMLKTSRNNGTLTVILKTVSTGYNAKKASVLER